MSGKGTEILKIPQYLTTQFIIINEPQKPETRQKGHGKT